MSNDMLAELQVDAYNHHVNGVNANDSQANMTEILSMGPGIAYHVCPSF